MIMKTRWAIAGWALGLGGLLLTTYAVAADEAGPARQPAGYTIPIIDLSAETARQVVVDREANQYLGHPTTVLLEDGKTLLCVYPKGHGRGGIVYKRSPDGGLTWSDRLPTPASWATSLEVPTLHRVVDAQGTRRLIMWSGLYPARLAVSEDDGATWSELTPAGDWGGIVVMGFVEPLRTPGRYLAMFHDDGRFFAAENRAENPPRFTLYKTFSEDGGLSWSPPEAVYSSTEVHLCEPGCIRSPDGRQLAVLLRENSRTRNSHVIFSNDEGRTWTAPRELPGALTGDRHTGTYAPDGRLFIAFRDTTRQSPTQGDWVAWVGTYEDIVEGREGQYRVRLMDNHQGGDCAYPGVVLLPNGTIVTTTYGHWTPNEPPYIVSVRLTLDELDARADRMGWWRDARFGLFIHWGLYAVPAGEWGGQTGHGEWILSTAQIPLEEYEKFVGRFNPVDFDADAWVRMAKDAGMKYIVFTSKHHEGFCLFDSAYTDYDIMATPFRRDILKELSEACRKAGIRMCWYHSIMDWHHPDYLPRRPWETRSADGADFDRYVAYLKNQLAELVTNYGEIGVLWFDGEWESTWSHERGSDLYDYVRSLQPSIIINNRVDVGRGGMEGFSESNKYRGDFGTPEQQVPATGIPGVDWESCITMNRHWGYNKNDHVWKSAEDLIRMLVDIAAKGGNFLLNVGPTAEGQFPQPSIDRLAAIGRWMAVNGDSIYGTQAGPFPSLPWGRCTAKQTAGDQWTLYLHVFDWPAGGELVLPAVDNEIRSVRLLARPEAETLPVARRPRELAIALPAEAPDPVDSVVEVRVTGRPVVIGPPRIEAASPQFINRLEVTLATDVGNAEIRYTVDGSEPAASSPRCTGPFTLAESATVRARLFRRGEALSDARAASFERVNPRPADDPGDVKPGLAYACYEGEWTQLPEFASLEPASQGVANAIHLDPRTRPEQYAMRFTGFIRVPADAIYTFHVDSDDGSRLLIGSHTVVDNDGLHSPTEVAGHIALAAGLHPLTLLYFQGTGGQELNIGVSTPLLPYQPIPPDWLFHR